MLGVVKSKYMLNQWILKLKLTNVNLNLKKLTDSCDIIHYQHGKNLWLQTTFKHRYSKWSFFVLLWWNNLTDSVLANLVLTDLKTLRFMSWNLLLKFKSVLHISETNCAINTVN